MASPHGLAVEPNGDVLVADGLNGAVRRIDRAGTITTVTDFAPMPDSTSTDREQVKDVAVAADGSVIVPHSGRRQVFRISPTGQQTVLAGGGNEPATTKAVPATSVDLGHPEAVAVGPDGDVWIGTGQDGHDGGGRGGTPRSLLRVDHRTGTIRLVAGEGADEGSPGPTINNVRDLAVLPNGEVAVADGSLTILSADGSKGRRVPLPVSGQVKAVIADGDGGLYVGSWFSPQSGQPAGGAVVHLDAQGRGSVIAGQDRPGSILTGRPATCSTLPGVRGLVRTANGGVLVSLQYGNRIVRLDRGANASASCASDDVLPWGDIGRRCRRPILGEAVVGILRRNQGSPL